MADTKDKTILVTGGAGFIGSHLCERLVKDGHRVISLDNYFTGTVDNHVEGVEYRTGHTKDIAAHVPEMVDLVYHLGEYSRVEQSFDDMSLVWDFNIAGTFAVLEFCRRQACKLVYAGSSTKFSNDGLGRHQSPYAWTKATNTDLVANYGTWYGLSYAITYFYNVYGPREITMGPYATVIGIFKEKFQKGEPLPVRKPGTQERNFTHVYDIVNGLILVGERGEGDDFGLGASRSYTIEAVARLFGGDIEWLPNRPGNRLGAPLDTTRATALGWQARETLEDHIAQFVKESAA